MDSTKPREEVSGSPSRRKISRSCQRCPCRVLHFPRFPLCPIPKAKEGIRERQPIDSHLSSVQRRSNGVFSETQPFVPLRSFESSTSPRGLPKGCTEALQAGRLRIRTFAPRKICRVEEWL